MKLLVSFSVASAAVFAVMATFMPGPVVLEYPAGTSCCTWREGDDIFLSVTNRSEVSVSGTIVLNEIFEKLRHVDGCCLAEIDGRWIQVEIPPRAAATMILGK